jgi:hypothetical protein
MKELGERGELLNKDAYSRLSNSRLWSWRIAAADADEKHSRLAKQDTGGSDALCLGANPVIARIFHESPAATTDMAVLPGVLGCSFGYAQDKLTLRRTVQVRLGTNTLRLPGGTPIFAVSRQQFMKYSG